MKLSKGYDTIIGEGEMKLSHGQYQLLALACALVCNPPILLLDEVTSGLDSITEVKIFKALKEISRDRIILTISHRISGIIDADYQHQSCYVGKWKNCRNRYATRTCRKRWLVC